MKSLKKLFSKNKTVAVSEANDALEPVATPPVVKTKEPAPAPKLASRPKAAIVQTSEPPMSKEDRAKARARKIAERDAKNGK